MTPGKSDPPANTADEIPRLIETLLASERRLEVLTAGEVDTVSGRDGRIFVMGRAQAELRNSDAAKQAAILNALPAHIALIDARGVIISVNEAWRNFVRANSLLAPGCSVGQNYLDVCDGAEGDCSAEASAAAAGIRSVLNGAEKGFSLEYPCHSSTEQRWFLLTVTPLASTHPRGAVVMHSNITECKRAQDVIRKATRNVADDRRNRVRVELLALIAATVAFYGLAAHFNWFEVVTGWILVHAVGQMDEIIFTMLFLIAGLGVFAFRRWRESESELTIGNQSMAAMELLHDELDRRVKDRTEELGSANRSLGAEVAERQRAMEALRESEKRFSGAFEYAPIGMALVSPEGKWLKVNPALCALLGYSEVEFLHTGFVDITHPDDIELSRESARRAIVEQLRSFQFEKRYIHKGGHIVTALLKISLLRDDRGMPRYFVSQIQDITERKRAEDALKALSQKTERRERMLSTMLSSISDFAYLFDRKGRFLFANRPLLDLWGISLEAAVGKDFVELGYPEELAAKLRRQIEEVFVTKYSVTGETLYSSPTGLQGYYEYIFSPAFAADGSVDFVVGSTRDISERKRNEEALRASEASMAAAQRIAHFGSWEIQIADSDAVDSNPLRWSDEMYRIAGYEPGAVAVTNEFFFSRIPEEEHEPIRSALGLAIREKKQYSAVHRFIRPDGEIRFVQEIAQILYDEKTDRPFKIVGTAHDITERRRAEDAVRGSEEKFRQLTAIITDVFWMTTPETPQMLYVSPAYEKIWGQSVQSLYANPLQWNHAILPEDRPGVSAAFAGLGIENSSVSAEYRIQRPDGTIRWIYDRGFVVRDASGAVIRRAGIASDVTERKLAEHALVESQQRLALATESAHIGIWDLDVAENKLIWNPEMYKLYGVGENEFSGAYDAWQNGLHPADRARAEADFTSALLGVRDFHSEFRVVWRNGEVHYIEAHGVTQRPNNGPATRMIGVNWDITPRKLAEAALEKTHLDLMEASRLAGKAEVATEVLHNVGNVLNSVNVASSCIADSLRKSKWADLQKIAALLHAHETDLGSFITTDAKGKHVPAYLQQLAAHLKDEQAAVLNELAGLQKDIEHIKAIVKMQQTVAKGPGIVESLKSADLVEDALKINAGGLARHRITVVRKFEDGPPITVEKHKLLQILINLVRNAKDACAGSEREERRITVCVNHGQDTVRISVGDNGVGILPENLTRIFAHGFTTKKDGHGFGLHSGILAAQEMGARLTVASDGIGAGSTFTLEVPYKPIKDIK